MAGQSLGAVAAGLWATIMTPRIASGSRVRRYPVALVSTMTMMTMGTGSDTGRLHVVAGNRRSCFWATAGLTHGVGIGDYRGRILGREDYVGR